jgi:hypothetical protein
MNSNTIYVTVEGVISKKEYGDIANLASFERELDEHWGEGCWAWDREDLVTEDECDASEIDIY